jgi:uncharacterized protein with FMN-binding domain
MAPKRNNLVALGSAAVLAVYSAGYVRTRSAAEAQTRQPPEIRPAIPPRATPTPAAPAPVEAPKSAAKVASAAKKEDRQKHVRENPGTEARTDSAPISAVATVDTTQKEPPAAPIASTTPVAPDSVKKDSTAKSDSVKLVVRLKDGTWHGYGTSPHGDIEAEVEIKDGRITAARITGCYTRYSCSWIDPLLPQVVKRQSYDVDYVSGATQSSDAFRYAVWEALSRAK